MISHHDWRKYRFLPPEGFLSEEEFRLLKDRIETGRIAEGDAQILLRHTLAQQALSRRLMKRLSKTEADLEVIKMDREDLRDAIRDELLISSWFDEELSRWIYNMPGFGLESKAISRTEARRGLGQVLVERLEGGKSSDSYSKNEQSIRHAKFYSRMSVEEGDIVKG